jgi:hypothetical protein
MLAHRLCLTCCEILVFLIGWVWIADKRRDSMGRDRYPFRMIRFVKSVELRGRLFLTPGGCNAVLEVAEVVIAEPAEPPSALPWLLDTDPQPTACTAEKMWPAYRVALHRKPLTIAFFTHPNDPGRCTSAGAPAL